MVILGAPTGLNVMQKLRKIRLLCGTCAQHHHQVLNGEIDIGGTQIHAVEYGAMDVAFELDHLRFIDLRGHARCRYRRWRAGCIRISR